MASLLALQFEYIHNFYARLSSNFSQNCRKSNEFFYDIAIYLVKNWRMKHYISLSPIVE